MLLNKQKQENKNNPFNNYLDQATLLVEETSTRRKPTLYLTKNYLEYPKKIIKTCLDQNYLLINLLILVQDSKARR